MGRKPRSALVIPVPVGNGSARKGHCQLTPAIIQRARFLLPISYTPQELRLHLGMEPPPGQTEEWVNRKIRDWQRRGLTFTKSETGRVVVHGEEVKRWIEAQIPVPKSQRQAYKLPPGMMWCVTCQSPQPASDLQPRMTQTPSGTRYMVSGRCPKGHHMMRTIKQQDWQALADAQPGENDHDH